MILPLVGAVIFGMAVPQAMPSTPQEDAPAPATQINALAGVAPDTVTLGDPFQVQIRVRGTPADATVSFGDFTLVEPAESTQPPAVLQDENGDWTATYQLRAWITSDSLVGTFPFRIRTSDGSAEDRQVRVRLPVVRSVLPADSALHHPQPAKGIVPLTVVSPATPHPWLPWIAAALVLALVAWLALRRRGAPVMVPRDPRSVALAELQEIERLGLMEKGQPEHYHVQVSRVLRRYVANCEGGGEHLSSVELIEVLQVSGFDAQLVEDLAALLRRADRVKFAGAAGSADAEASRAFGQAVREWILIWPDRGGGQPTAEAA